MVNRYTYLLSSFVKGGFLSRRAHQLSPTVTLKYQDAWSPLTTANHYKTKNQNQSWIVRVFPRLAPTANFIFEFWLVECVIYLLSQLQGY